MRIHLNKRASRLLIASVMLLAFTVRALVPQGFMPAHDRPFSIEVCPEGFPAQLLAHLGHHHHEGGHLYTEHCVFGTACANGPPSQAPSLTGTQPVELALVAPAVAAPIGVQLVYLPHARGPPTNS